MRIDIDARPSWAHHLLALALFLPCLHAAHDPVSHPPAATALASLPPEHCESRTVNYITHSLPQQCLRSSWTGLPATSAPSPDPAEPADTTSAGSGNGTDAAATNSSLPLLNGTETGRPGADAEEDSQDLATAAFMSFEEWKEMMLRKSGQDPASVAARKQRESAGNPDAPSDHPAGLDSLAEDADVQLDFEVLSDKISGMTGSTPAAGGSAPPSVGKDVREEPIFYDDGKTQYLRSKDAGKTCKERFNYASFDAGATILKAGHGAKNAKAVLGENKDTYMLLECATDNKFLIVELSDDVLVDTVVLANFEFFSSMIRRFRVSVSDRYPQKMEKWIELGIFEARNTRDIQPFLVEHPQIYTKYIRIEFLAHYGTEYYCPVSLLRVHGTRMLDSWKEPDEEDDVEEIDAPPATERIEAPTEPAGHVTNSSVVEQAPAPANNSSSGQVGLTNWKPFLYANLSHGVCYIDARPSPAAPPSSSTLPPSAVSERQPAVLNHASTEQPAPTCVEDKSANSPVSTASTTHKPIPSSSEAADTSTANSSSTNASANSVPTVPPAHPSPRSNASDPSSSSQPPIIRVTNSILSQAATPKNKTGTASSSATIPAPTVQESFFKAISKRLQFLESNTSLSLQYIEEQSRFLQEALKKMENRQISRVDAFLDNLNRTVLAELRTVRTQYDQIWQSTVIALETQREQSQHELVALGARLNLLADEVVFQKRMAILQSALLLACLALVIFSRGIVGASLDMALLHGPASLRTVMSPRRGAALVDDYSPAASPVRLNLRRASPSDSSPRPPHLTRSVSYNDKVLPLTPSSDYCHEGTPIIHIDDVPTFFEDAGSLSGSPPKPIGDSDLSRRSPLSVRDEMADDDEVASPDYGYDVSGLRDHDRRDTLSRPDGVRKPLPALPEDTSLEGPAGLL